MKESLEPPASEMIGRFDASTGQAEVVARSLSETNFRWLIAGLGGGALTVWALSELGQWVLAFIELQQRCSAC